MTTDLFGNEIADAPAPLIAAKRRATQPKGYSAPPGTGPKGETCASCKFYVRIQYSKTYRKCGLMRRAWTHGPGTDIRASAPACRNWSMPDAVQWEREPMPHYAPPIRMARLTR